MVESVDITAAASSTAAENDKPVVVETFTKLNENENNENGIFIYPDLSKDQAANNITPQQPIQPNVQIKTIPEDVRITPPTPQPVQVRQVGATGNGQKMMLQLVLPQAAAMRGGDEQDVDYDGPNGMSTPYIRQTPRRMGSSSSQQGYINRALSTQDVSHSPNGLKRPPSMMRINSYMSQSGMSTGHLDSEEHLIPPSSPKAKMKATIGWLVSVLGLSYLLFLITFGSVVFIADAVVGQYPIGESFCLYMLIVGMAYFLFLYIDIRIYVTKAKRAYKAKLKREREYEEHMHQYNQLGFQDDVEMQHGPEGNLHLSIPLPPSAMHGTPIEPIPHDYCFKHGRHIPSFYLKLGAAWFCFGLIVHSILVLSYQVVFLSTSDKNEFAKCGSIPSLIVDILFPLYSFMLLFFIFKYSNVIINKGAFVAKLAMFHAIGTSLAFWVFTIVRETMDAIHMKYLYKQQQEAEAALLHDIHKRSTDNYTISQDLEYSSAVHSRRTASFLSEDCPGPEALNTIYRNFSPYLYPFTIEFCILIVGIFYVLYSHIEECPKKQEEENKAHDTHKAHGDDHHGPSTSKNLDVSQAISEGSHCKTAITHETAFATSLVMHADCHAANKGLFAGFIVLAGSLASIILFFVAMSEPSYVSTGILVNNITDCILLVIMTISVIFAYAQTSTLDVSIHPMSKLDDVLLYIAVPAFFLESIFSMAPAIANGNAWNISLILLQLLQILIQTPFIIDGLRRCSNSEELRRRKPGRELVTFLVVCNVCVWLILAFSIKNADTGDERYDFYGDVVWTVLNHLSLPLIMFYRFHASVCLVDMWKAAYEADSGH